MPKSLSVYISNDNMIFVNEKVIKNVIAQKTRGNSFSKALNEILDEVRNAK